MADKLISELTNQAATTDAFVMEVQDPTTSVTKKATQAVVTLIEKNARIAQDDVIEAGVGLAAAGTYAQPSGTAYIDTSTDVMVALVQLDTAIAASGIILDEVSIPAVTLNGAGTAHVEIIATPGANKYIELVSASISLDFDSVATDWVVGAPKGVLQYPSGGSHFMEWSNAFMESGADIINKGTWTSEVGIITNEKIEFTFDLGANASVGDSRIKIAFAYLIWDI